MSGGYKVKGWNTWDTYSATTYVCMPEGYGIRIGLKEYLRGQYLQYPNIGRMEDGEERIYPGYHAYDGSYTEMEIEWRRLRVRIETAAAGTDFVAKITLLENTTRFVPTVVLEAGVFWNTQLSCRYQGEDIVWSKDTQSAPCQTMKILQGDLVKDSYLPVSTPYLAVKLDQPVYVSVGNVLSADQGQQMLTKAKNQFLSYSEKYGEYKEAWIGMQTSLAWNLMYDAQYQRALVNVSRLWNMDRGGYAMFCWDNFFMGLMIAADDLPLGKNNIHQSLLEIAQVGFVPNGSFGNGRKSFDRSQPPVGAMCAWEIYQMDHDLEFLRENFDLMLQWNRWWIAHRKNDTLLSWGSEEYDNKWEMPGIHQILGASLESGLDNSPMYIPEEVTFDPERNILNLWDAALNSMYIYDCEVLYRMAALLGREEEGELRQRACQFKENISALWNEDLGIYCNFKTDTQQFSTVLTPCNFYPLLTGVPDERQVRRMMEEYFLNPEKFGGDWFLPSVSRDHPMYPENDYWRGRIWAPLNFLVYMGMRNYPNLPERQMLVDNSLKLFMQEWTEHRHVHENYNADTGYGDDVKNSDRNYAWGGLLVFIALMESGMIS